jgi:hypothetical protein
MKNNTKLFLVLAVVFFITLALTKQANAQVLRASLRHPEFRLEVGRVVKTVAIKNLQVDVFTSGGILFEKGTLVGSVALLIEPFKDTKGFSFKIGPSYDMVVGRKPEYDLVLQFGLRQNEFLAVGYRRIVYAKRL